LIDRITILINVRSVLSKWIPEQINTRSIYSAFVGDSLQTWQTGMGSFVYILRATDFITVFFF